MENVGSDIEIIELAISRETDAYLVYMKLSELTDDPRMVEVFENFANEELEHKTRLELELMKIGVTVPIADLPVLDHDENEELAEVNLQMDYKDALLFAMDKERRALRLYVDLAAITKNKSSREMLLTLAENEAMHQVRFEVEYNTLMRRQE